MGGFARLRADEVLSPRGKVPKGRRGRPKGAWNMAAPGPPVAKIQCTASLAGARPARFTSVPGRATVAFKVGFHFVKAKSLRDPRIRLWRKRGLAQLIPPPAFGRRVIPGVPARGRHDSAPCGGTCPGIGAKENILQNKIFLPVLPNFCGRTRFFQYIGESLQTIQGILGKTTLTALGTHSMMERITKGEIHPPWGGSMGADAPKEDEKR